MRSRTWTISGAFIAVLGVTGCVNLADYPDYDPTPTPSSVQSPAPSADPSPVAEVTPIDSGPIEYAQGEAQPAGSNDFTYVVAAGDTPEAIATRFGVCVLDVLESNPPQDPWLVVGQTINVARVTDIPVGTHECQFDVDRQ